MTPSTVAGWLLFCPWDFSGKNTGVVCHFPLQGIFPIQGSNPCLLHWQVDSLPLSQQGSPLEEKKWEALCADLTDAACLHWKVLIVKTEGGETPIKLYQSNCTTGLCNYKSALWTLLLRIGVHVARERAPGWSQYVAPESESLSHSSASLWARTNDLWIYVTVILS